MDGRRNARAAASAARIAKLAASCATAASILALGWKKTLMMREPGQRLRFHVLDVVDRGGEGALAADGDDLGHLLGRDAAVGPDHADDGDVDLGEDVGGHAEDRQHAQDDDQHRHHDEGIGPAQREPDDPHRAICSFLHATARRSVRWALIAQVKITGSSIISQSRPKTRIELPAAMATYCLPSLI